MAPLTRSAQRALQQLSLQTPVVEPSAVPELVLDGDQQQLSSQTPVIEPSARPELVLDEDQQQLSSQTPVVEPTTGSELVLDEDQQHLVKLILSGSNVFYTGSAGCGKSTVLRAVVKRLEEHGKRVDIVAPTGRAALDVNGMTTYLYAGWRVGDFAKPLEELERAATTEIVVQRMTSTHVLIIDEISMIENHHFERLNAAMQSARSDNRPFGGVQVVVTGDFCQLPPIEPFYYCIECGKRLQADAKWEPTYHSCNNPVCDQKVFWNEEKWAFSSKAWEECEFEYVYLKKIHRQSDRQFIDLLERFRMGNVNLAQASRILLKPRKALNTTFKPRSANRIGLYPTRKDVDTVNQARLDENKNAYQEYAGLDGCKWQKQRRHGDDSMEVREDAPDGAIDVHRYDLNLKLKHGMKVILLQNLDPSLGLVNGTQGTIMTFKPLVEAELPKASNGKDNGADEEMTGDAPSLVGAHARYRQEEIRRFSKNLKLKNPWPYVQFPNNVKRTIYPDCAITVVGDLDASYNVVSRTQIPLIAGYAVTIHRSQGMTLSRYQVDLTHAFEASQVYVALSRAKSLDGLEVIALPERIKQYGNPQVIQFMKEKLGYEYP